LHYQIPTIASNSSEVTLHLANFIFDENEWVTNPKIMLIC
jgi:hypothetical protein